MKVGDCRSKWIGVVQLPFSLNQYLSSVTWEISKPWTSYLHTILDNPKNCFCQYYITAIPISQHQCDIAAFLICATYNFTSLGNLSFIRFLAISEPKIFHLDFPGYYTNLPGNIAAAASDERVIRLRWDARFLGCEPRRKRKCRSAPVYFVSNEPYGRHHDMSLQLGDLKGSRNGIPSFSANATIGYDSELVS